MITLNLEQAITPCRFIVLGDITLPITPLTIKLCAKIDKQGNVILMPADPNTAQYCIIAGKMEISMREQHALIENYITQTGDLTLNEEPFLFIHWKACDFIDKKLDLNLLIREKLLKLINKSLDKF